MATSTAPPPYEEAMAVINNISDLTPEMMSKIHEAIAAKLAEPQTTRGLLEETKALGSRAMEINAIFHDVSNTLEGFDRGNFKDKNGNPLPQLQPQWKALHERFLALLLTSRKTAIEMAAHIQEFTMVYLPLIESSIQEWERSGTTAQQRTELLNEVKPELNHFITELEAARESSLRPESSSEQPSSELEHDVSNFVDHFQSVDEDTTPELRASLSKVDNEINDLLAQIEDFNKMIKSLEIAVGTTGTVAQGAGIGSLVLGPLGPIVAGSVALVGAAAAAAELAFLKSYVGKREDAEKRLDHARSKKAELELEMNAIAALKSKLTSQHINIGRVCGRLGQFAEIWSTFVREARMVQEQLERAAEFQDFDSLKPRIQMIKNAYVNLNEALKAYSINIS